MNPQTPGNLSPEGRHAAARVRTIFFGIAAANIVLFAIFLWQRNAHRQPDQAPAANPVEQVDGEPAN